jgi:H+-translocating NAD(P) transhydrogenase subunit beta
VTRLQTIELIYLLCSVCFIVALKGLSSPRWARYGNLVGAAGMLVAIGTTFALPGLGRIWLIVVGMVVGTAIAVPAARMVKMTAIPQMVAAFNGVGGGAAALVSLAETHRADGDAGFGTAAAVLFSVLIGAVSFTGSAVTFAKLQELMTGRPIVLPQQRLLNLGLAVAATAFVVWGLATSDVAPAVLLLLVALVLGVLFVLPVGGADGHPRRGFRHVAHAAHGQGDGPAADQHPVRRHHRQAACRRRGSRRQRAVGADGYG